METTGGKIKEWPQILAILIAALSGFSSAAIFNWTSPSIPILISDKYLEIDLESASYLTIIPSLVNIIASPLYAVCVEKYGRKYCLLSIGVLHLISWILIALAESIYVFYASRVVFGISEAGLFVALPIYIAEVATPKVRGTWGNSMALLLYLGQFAINVVGFYFDIKKTAYIFGSISIIYFVLFMFMPETPTYYIMKDKPQQAVSSLIKLRQTEKVSAEYEQLNLDVKRQLSESGTFKDIFLIDSNRNAIFIMTLVRGIQQLSGISSFAVYTQYIFAQAGGDIGQGHASMIYCGILAFCNLIGALFMDKLGRKIAMILSCIGCFVALSGEAIYFYIKENDLADVTSVSWLPLAGMVFYVVNFSVGLGLIPTLFVSELISSSVRGKSGAIMTVVLSAYIAGVTKLFQYLVVRFGLSVPFTLFAVCTFVSIFLSYFFVPETKGRTLEEIQQQLKGKKKYLK